MRSLNSQGIRPAVFEVLEEWSGKKPLRGNEWLNTE